MRTPYALAGMFCGALVTWNSNALTYDSSQTLNYTLPFDQVIEVRTDIPFATVYMNGYWSLDKPIEVHCHNDTQLTISFQNFYVTQHYFKFARGGGDYRFIKAVGCASVNYEGSVQLSVNQTIIAY